MRIEAPHGRRLSHGNRYFAAQSLESFMADGRFM